MDVPIMAKFEIKEEPLEEIIETKPQVEENVCFRDEACKKKKNWPKASKCALTSDKKPLQKQDQHLGSGKVRACPQCTEFRTADGFAFHNHLVAEHGIENPFQCKTCGYSATTKRLLARHERQVWNLYSILFILVCSKVVFPS